MGGAAAVELEIDGVAVKIARGADAGCHRGGDRRAEDKGMIGPGADARVLVATRPVDFRKGADSLAALVAAEFGGDPFSGVIYCFRAKKAQPPTFCIQFALPRRSPILGTRWRGGRCRSRRSVAAKI